MSGYRSIHRENLGSFPIWQVASSPVLSNNSGTTQVGAAWRVWLACGDGVVRGYLVIEKTLEMQKNALNAAACNCILTHVLLGSSHHGDLRRSLVAVLVVPPVGKVRVRR